MAIQHVYNQTVADGTATSVVRPSDWNSAHKFTQTISGNTLGTSTQSGTNLVWAGGSNITLSASTAANAATISVHAPASSSLVAGANITLSTNGSTISVVGAAAAGYNSVQFTNSTANSTQAILWAGNSNGSGNITLGLTGSTVTGSVPAGGGAVVQMSGGNTSGTVNTYSTGTVAIYAGDNITLSQSSNTISVIGPADHTMSFFEPNCRGVTASGSLANGTVYFQPFYLPEAASMYRMHLATSHSSQGTTTLSISGSISGGSASSGTGLWGVTGTALLMSRYSTGTNTNSTNIVTCDSATWSFGYGVSASVSWSTNASSATVSWTTSGAASYVGSVNSTGGVTTTSSGTSGSSTFSSTSTNANSFSSSYVMTFGSSIMSGIRPVVIPNATLLTPGEYWLGLVHFSGPASTNMPLHRVCVQNGGMFCFQSHTTQFMDMGNVATNATSNWYPGWGSYSASSNTTASSGIAITAITGNSNLQTYFQFVAQEK